MSSNVSIHLDSQGPYRAGDRLRGRLSVAALEQLELTHALVHLAWTTFGRGEVTLGAKANVVCTESVWVRKGKSSSVESATNLTLPLLLDSSLQLEAGESRELIGSAVLPEDCLPTFGKLSDSSVTWEVVVELERSGVDFREQVPLRVSA